MPRVRDEKGMGEPKGVCDEVAGSVPVLTGHVPVCAALGRRHARTGNQSEEESSPRRRRPCAPCEGLYTNKHERHNQYGFFSAGAQTLAQRRAGAESMPILTFSGALPSTPNTWYSCETPMKRSKWLLYENASPTACFEGF
jgi:hypothetical protein